MQQRLDQAISRFLAELGQVLTGLQEEIAARARAGDFEEVQRLSQEAQRVQELQQHVRKFQKPRSEAAHSEPAASAPSQDNPDNRRKRAPRGDITPQRAYRLPILKALDILGGHATVKAVFEQVHRLMRDRLKPGDYRIVPSGKEARWMNAIRWEGYPLRQQGYLRADLPSGVWEITDAGRALLRQLEQETPIEVHEAKETYTAEDPQDDEELLWLLEEET